MEALTYRQSPKQRRNSAIISALFILGGVALFFQADDHRSWKVRLAIFLAVFGVLVLIRILRNKVLITVDKKGIKSELNAIGYVSWSYIEGFELKPRPGGLAVVAKINNPEMLMNEKSSFSKFLMKTNMKKFGSPVIYPDQFFDKAPQVVIEELEAYRQSIDPATLL